MIYDMELLSRIDQAPKCATSTITKTDELNIGEAEDNNTVVAGDGGGYW